MAQKIAKVIHRIVFYGCFIGMLVLLIMMLLTTSDVIGRSIFGHPVSGTYELTGYMMAVTVLLGLGYAQQAESNVRVEFLTEKMPPKVQGFLVTLFSLMAAVFFSIVAWEGFKGGIRVMHEGTASDILHIPEYPFQLLVGVGAFLLMLELIIKFFTSAYQLSKGKYVKRDMGKEVQGLN